MIDYYTPTRPTRMRLLVAMCVSACAVALILASLGSIVEYAVSVSETTIAPGSPLVIHINKGAGDRNSDSTNSRKVDRSLPQEKVASTKFSEFAQESASADAPEAPTNTQPKTDWHAIADEVAIETVDQQFKQEESRASMWRKTHSMMFEPTYETRTTVEEPVISDFQFIRRVHVLGLGVTIGSCFIGIPFAGVPVEQRTIGITLFVCA